MIPVSEACDSSDQQVLSVADLDRDLRRAVEKSSSGVWVQGEVGQLKVAASGHAYFSLSDEHESAMIDAVAYRVNLARFRSVLKEGERVVVRGTATVYAPRGRLQFTVDAMRPAGRGALLEALEKLKERLAAEGLFSSERKRHVPSSARTVGVVTSASGAVIHDIIQVAFRRGPVRILLAPALVQGEQAAQSIVDAINCLERVRGLDVLIIGRGGGAAEDLMAFNDERVVRRLAACKLPVVSAVGHEVDITLTDLVADARASTPSQAAEMVVADQSSQQQLLNNARERLRRAIRSHLTEDRTVLERLQVRLGDPRNQIAERQQRLDELGMRLRDAMEKRVILRRRTLLEKAQRALVARHPKEVLAKTRGRLDLLHQAMVAAMRVRLRAKRASLADAAASLSALSPLSVLARGYSITTTVDGRAVREANQVAPGESISIRLSLGHLDARVEKTYFHAQVAPVPEETRIG